MTRDEDLIRIAKKLDKMVSRNNTEGAMDLLKELQSFNMTLKLLQETRIGMSVNNIRKHCTRGDVSPCFLSFICKRGVRVKFCVSFRSLDVKRKHDSDRKPSDKSRKEKQNDRRVDKKRPSDEPGVGEKQLRDVQSEKHLKDVREEKQPPAESLKVHELPGGKHKPEPTQDRPLEDLKNVSRHVEPARKETPMERHEEVKKDKNREEIRQEKRERTSRESWTDRPLDKPLFERKDSVDNKVSKKHSDESKRERKDSSDSKTPPPKKLTVEIKKEKLRRDSCDSKPSQPVRRHSSDSKPDRWESTDSKKSSSPTAKKLAGERRESLGCKAPQPAHQQRKLSTDSTESRKGRSEAPSTPTTPTSPMSPSFSSAGGPLPPHLATGDSIRDKCIEMLAAALRTDNDYKDFGTNCDSMAAEIEDHIYQENKATDMKYKNRVRSRISNLKDPKNPELRRNVLAGSIELSRIATMSAEEMASNELKKLRNVLTQEAIREHQMAKTGGTTTDLLQCSKCKKKNCTYNQVQTRSADEPMTTFVLCNECGNRWKFC
uniref:Transcription elongation factor A (SII), 3 n=1 Tax=Nothobranchius pienaari TaxID=704102 RepID=A0A1A8LUI6_9TELE